MRKLPTASGTEHFQDLGHSFSLYGPPSRPITYMSQVYEFVIDLMHKWLPIKNSFVSIKISPTNLVFELIIQRKFCFQTRLVGLI